MKIKIVSGTILPLLFIGMFVITFNIHEADASEASATEWNKTYGGYHEDYACSVVDASDGGYIVAGYTSSFGAGLQDVWLVKVDSSGNMQWNKTYGGTGWDAVYSVVQSSDEGYALAGYTSSFGAGKEDVWLVKIDSSGNVQWSKTYGGTENDGARSFVETSDGGYILAGYTISFGDGEYSDFWLIKSAPGVQQPALTVSLTANPTEVYSNGTTTITFLATSEGAPISGATINLTSDKGGSFSSVVDQGDGYYIATFIAPTVSTSTTVTITAKASKPDYISGQGQTQVTVQPLEANHGNLNIYINDVDGKPLTGVAVASTSQPTDQSVLSGTTDANGLVTFHNILQGSYMIKANKTGYEDKTWTVTVAAAQTTTDTVTLSETAETAEFPPIWIVLAAILIIVISVATVFAIKKIRKPKLQKQLPHANPNQ